MRRFIALCLVCLIACEAPACVRAGDGSVDLASSLKRDAITAEAFVCPVAALAPAVTGIVAPADGVAREDAARASAIVALVCAATAAAISAATGSRVVPVAGDGGIAADATVAAD